MKDRDEQGHAILGNEQILQTSMRTALRDALNAAQPAPQPRRVRAVVSRNPLDEELRRLKRIVRSSIDMGSSGL